MTYFRDKQHMNNSEKKEMTFWDHLDELKKVIVRIFLVVLILACVAFLLKDLLFSIVLAPQHSDFILYRFFNESALAFNLPSLAMEEFHVELISTQLTSQFMIHMTVALYAGILLATPYITYLLFGFISPALHATERRNCLKIMFPAFTLFFMGILLNYFIIFPLSFRFLATYQVSPEVKNMITLSSYISSFSLLSLLMGAAFEIPVIAWLLAKFHLIHSGILKKFRKHSLVVILLIAAIITPSSDIFTLLLVSVPLYLLYELSICVVSRSQQRQDGE